MEEREKEDKSMMREWKRDKREMGEAQSKKESERGISELINKGRRRIWR